MYGCLHDYLKDLNQHLWKYFLHSGSPLGILHSKKFQKTLILAFEASSALSRENETKIVKFTHSAQDDLQSEFTVHSGLKNFLR